MPSCWKLGGSEWESNPPATSKMPPAGFEDRDDHRTACASVVSNINKMGGVGSQVSGKPFCLGRASTLFFGGSIWRRGFSLIFPGVSALHGLALIKGFPYHGAMNITLSLDDDLVREVRKIAVERDTTLTGLVRAHLQELAAEHAKSGRKRRELEALQESFEKYQFNLGKRTWKREDLYERR